MSSSLSKLLRILAVLGAVTLAAACGDDDSGDDPTIEIEDGAGDTTGDDGGDDGASGDESPSGDDDGGDGDGGGAASGDLPNPCDLVTEADLQTYFGSPFDEGEFTDSSEQAGIVQCTWSNTDAPPVKVVSIAVSTEDSLQEAFGRGAKEIHDLTRQQAEESNSISEADLSLGDDSYRTTSGIFVLDGDTSYTITSTGTSDEAIAGLKQMATKVVDG